LNLIAIFKITKMEKEDAKSKTGTELNPSTISTMTYEEIIRNNRLQHKGTFMDRSWRGV
jgi:hypothetical protein